jgi:hypothetical protein
MARTTLNWALMTWLWILVGLIGFLMCVQLLMLVYAPKGTWHVPRMYKVTVREFDSDPQAAYPAIIIGKNVKPVPDDVFSAEDKGAKGSKDAEDQEDGKGQAEDKDPAPSGHGKVSAKDLEQDDEEEFQDRSIALMKSERKGLNVGDTFWVLDNYYRSSLRPPQFRLTPMRLLIEFPEPLLVLALLCLYVLRKAQAKAVKAEEEVPRERVVLRDDFHARADRFSEPKDDDPKA